MMNPTTVPRAEAPVAEGENSVACNYLGSETNNIINKYPAEQSFSHDEALGLFTEFKTIYEEAVNWC
jgi:hypothetical protein